MTTLKENHKNWALYRQLKKCGELTTSMDLRYFGLNCNYCQTIFLRLDTFIKHIKKEHSEAITDLFNQPQDEPETDQKVAVDWDESTINEKYPDEVKTEILLYSNENDEQDPIEFCKPEIKLETVYVKEETLKAEPVTDISPDNGFFIESDTDSSADSIENDGDDILQANIDLFSLESRELLSHIIESIQKNPIIWDANHTEYSSIHKKLQTFLEISKDIEKNYKVILKPTAIRKTFINMRTLYREELREVMKNCKNNENEEESGLWFFKKIDFLSSPSSKPQSKKCLLMSDSQLMQLVDMYEAHPSLWNVDDDNYHNKPLKSSTFQNMTEQIRDTIGVNITQKQFEGRIKRMRKYYAADKRKRVQCEIKNKKFTPTRMKLYKKFKFLDAHIGPYRCEQCNEVVKTPDQYKKHQAAHDGSKAFKCKLCNKGFNYVNALQLHVRTNHTGERPFVCSECGRAFASSHELGQHKTIHTGVKSHMCHICGKGFRSSSLLSRHKLWHNPETFRFQCSHCPKKFCDKHALKGHTNAHLKIRDYTCGVCGKGFFASKTLRQHELLHNKEKKYVCPFCDKAFAQIAGLHMHKRTQHNTMK